MSISDIQKQLKEAVELACDELEWHEARNDGEALSHLTALAVSCGCEAKTADEMSKAIADHIDWLAGLRQEDRVEPCDGAILRARIDDLACRVAERERQPNDADESLSQRITALHNIVINRGKRIDALQDRVDSLTGRMSQLEREST